MSNRLKELREKRGKAIEDMRAVVTAAEAAGRATMSAEDQALYDKHFKAHTELSDEIKREEQLTNLERESALRALPNSALGSGPGASAAELENQAKAEREMKAFNMALIRGMGGVPAELRNDLKVGVDTEGGYLVPPMQFVRDLIKAVDDMVFVRRLATVIPVTEAQSLGVPSLDTDPADADWTTELATGNEDTAMAFGRRELHPHPLAKRIKVSNKLLRLAPGAENLVRQRLAYKFGITQEKGFLTGNGAGQPLGLFTANANGISTGRDISTGNTTTSITFDGLTEAKYGLKAQYRMRSGTGWMFHRDAMKQIAKLKDGDGQYIWRTSVREGEPDRLLGMAYYESEYAPNTFTTGLYVGMLGDYSNYWIADSLAMQLQRLVELYAETNQVGFIGRMESDGMPVLEEAFVRVKLA